VNHSKELAFDVIKPDALFFFIDSGRPSALCHGSIPFFQR